MASRGSAKRARSRVSLAGGAMRGQALGARAREVWRGRGRKTDGEARGRCAPLHHLEADLEADRLERRLRREDGVRVAVVPAETRPGGGGAQSQSAAIFYVTTTSRSGRSLHALYHLRVQEIEAALRDLRGGRHGSRLDTRLNLARCVRGLPTPVKLLFARQYHRRGVQRRGNGGSAQPATRVLRSAALSPIKQAAPSTPY